MAAALKGLALRLSRATRAVADVFLPRFCIVCGRPMGCETSVDLCDECEGIVALPGGPTCLKCAGEMGDYAKACPNCRTMNLAMNEAAAFGVYRGVLRERVLEFKYSSRSYLARTFGGLVGRSARRRWHQVRFDAVMGVALHAGRRRERGFDQAQAVAYHTAAALGVPYLGGMLRRVRATESQVGLSRSARLRNLKGAFSATPRAGIKTVLLVDDILTTGATLSEAARALKRAGVKAVYAAVVARPGRMYQPEEDDYPVEDGPNGRDFDERHRQ